MDTIIKVEEGMVMGGHPVSIEQVPILKCGPNNNWDAFRTKLPQIALEKYADYGRLVESEAYFVLPDVDKYANRDDINSFDRVLYLEASEARQMKILS